MSEYHWTTDDEYNHAAGTEPNFNESVYVNAFDSARGYGGWMRIGNRVNEGHAEMQVCLYLPDGRIACQFLRPDIARNDGFAAGGLRYDDPVLGIEWPVPIRVINDKDRSWPDFERPADGG